MELQQSSRGSVVLAETLTTRQYHSTWLAVIGVILTIGAETAWFAWQDQPVPGLLLAGIASFVLLRAPAVLEIAPDASSAQSRDKTPIRFRYLWLVAGIGLSLCVAARALQNPPGKVWWLLLAWLLSALLIFLAFVSFSSIRAWIRHVSDSFRDHRREWAFVVIMMLVAFGIRFMALGSFPADMLEDEGFFAAQAVDLRTVNAWEYSPFGYDSHSHPLFYHTLQAVSIKFLGQTLEAARLPSVLIGVLAVPGLYLAGRRMFNRRVAVIATLFLVAFPQHVHFSRLALNQPMDPTLAIWTLAFLVGALDRHDPVEYGLAGLTLGISQYGFSSARLIPLLVIAYVGLRFLHHRPDVSWRGLFLMALVSLVLVWPQAEFLIQTGESVVPRIAYIGVWEPKSKDWYIAATQSDQMPDYWVNQISRSFLAFVQVRDAGSFYRGFDPYLGWLAPVPFLLGVLYAIRRWKDPNHAMLLVWWIAVVVLGGIVVKNPPEFQRFVIAIPVLSILVSSGVIFVGDMLARLSRTLQPAQPVSWRAEYWGTPVVLVILLGIFNLTSYELDYRASDANTPNDLAVFWNDLATEILPPLQGYKIWLVSDIPPYARLADTGILRYLSPHMNIVSYTGSPDHLPGMLAAYPGKQAVIMLKYYPRVNDSIMLLNRLPFLARRFVLLSRKHDQQLAFIYESEP